MRAPNPDAQISAGHIPADLIPAGTDPRTVVVVHVHPQPSRSYAGPVVLVLAGAFGVGALVWVTAAVLLQLAQVAATVAASAPAIGGGLTIALKIRNNR
ncbi:hypothetical protein ACFWNG_15600 [Streptomyces sp. NPDC058391]|uniref:hypothetical protein n=1 Tax=Streptomyces sp. NPDC058391 TaxID=3346476 RepID=UPI003667EF01